jgi:sulfur carrier protein
MNILLNGEERQLDQDATVALLLEDLSLSGKRLAVELNEVILPRSQYGERHLSDGDKVEIVRAVGGG